MKKKVWKYLIPSLVFGAVAVIAAPVALTSCSFEQFAPNSLELHKKITSVTLTDEEAIPFQNKTIAEWKNLKVNDPQQIINFVVSLQLPALKNSGFTLNSDTNLSSLSDTLNMNNPLVVSMVLVFSQQTESNLNELKLIVPNIPVANIQSDFFQPPTLGKLVKNNKETYRLIQLQQINMATIMNTSLNEISNTKWTNAINLATPKTINGKVNVTPYIPLSIYRIKSIEYPNVKNPFVLITYEANPEYEPIVNTITHNWKDYCNIVVEVTPSPYLNKQEVTDFNINYAEAVTLFGDNIDQNWFRNQSPLTLYNILNNYVNGLKDVQPLRNCVNEQNEIYNWKLTPEIVTRQVNISFTTDTSNNDQNIYHYSFTISYAPEI